MMSNARSPLLSFVASLAMLSLAGGVGLRVPTVRAAEASAPEHIDRRPSLRGAFEQMGHGDMAEVTALDDSAASWVARWRLMAEAEHTLDASYFIVARDVFGLAFLGHLHQRARAGVQVNLIIDGRGSAPFSLPLLGLDEVEELVATGNADVRIYNPPLLQIGRSIIERSAVPVSAGMHAKILVADDARAIVGGRNIAAVYFAKRGETDAPVIDSDVLLRGERVVAALDDVVQREIGRWAQERVTRDAVNLVPKDELLQLIYGAMDAWLRGTIPDAPPARAAVLLEQAALSRMRPAPPLHVLEQARPYLLELARVRSLRGALFATSPLPHQTRSLEAHVIAAAGRIELYRPVDEASQPSSLPSLLPSSLPSSRSLSLSSSSPSPSMSPSPSPSRSLTTGDDTANDALVLAIASARDTIVIQSPYFMLTPRVLGALTRASARGVAITVVTNGPASSDNAASQALFIDTWPELEARMPTLRVFVGAAEMLHTKRVIVDGVLTIVGSHNLDPLSSHLNTEVLVALWSRDAAADAMVVVDKMLDGGDMLEYRIRRDRAGRAERDVDGHPIVEFGPDDHLPRARVEKLRALKQFLMSIRRIWDFDFMVW